MGNRDLKRVLKEVIRRAPGASRPELMAWVDAVAAASSGGRFQQGRSWLAIIALLLLALVTLVLGLAPGREALLLGAAAAALGMLVLLARLIGNRRLVPRALRSLYERALAIDCYIVQGASLDADGIDEFDRGNYSNEVTDRLDCRVDGREYAVFRYDYVNERQETVDETDSDGRTHTETRTVYDHYSRHGFRTPLKVRGTVRVGSDSPGYRGIRWRGESHDFNKAVRAFAGDEMSAAHFYKPAMQLLLVRQAAALPSFSAEFHQDHLWLSVDFGPLLAVHTPVGFDRPAELKAELGKPQRPRQMDRLIAFTRELERLTRDHFEFVE